MSGMLGRRPMNVPALQSRAQVFETAEGSKRFCKAWLGGVDSLLEPTSVLDVRSPSPSSTLSSSVAASSESGVQGSTESGGAVAVSGRAHESSEGHLVDCTSLWESGNEDGSVWPLGAVDNGEAGLGFVGTLQANPSDMQKEWLCAAGRDGICKQDGDGTASSIKEVIQGHLACGNEGPSLNSGFVQVSSMPREKLGNSTAKEGLHWPERLRLISSGPSRNAFEKVVVKSEDETLEACVLSCRKREREELLGEVVQGLSDCGQRDAGEWLSDWTEFGDNASVEKGAPPGQLQDLDDIFNDPASVPIPDFWLSENAPSMQKQIHNYGCSEGGRVNQASSFQSSGKGQLDLFEAVQAGLLCKGGSVTTSPRPAIISPSVQVLPCSFSAPITCALSQPFSPGAPPLPLPFQRHVVGDTARAFAPEFYDRKAAPPPAPRLLNAAFVPASPHFTSQVQLQEHAFPLPTSFAKAPQGSLFCFPRPEHLASKAVIAVEQKFWPLGAAPEGDASPKLSPEGPIRQRKREPEWQPADQFDAHVRGPHRSPHSPLSAEHAPLQAAGPEHVGRCVRLEELSLAERRLCAASEAAQFGDFNSAQAILARLNQQTSPSGHRHQLSPARRVALLFGEALSKQIAAISSSQTSYPVQQPPSNPTLELINKISAFKKFCEISPILQFSHFTSNQAILDAVQGEDFVHLVDFELGFGGQWASFMQEISQRSRGPPELKITTMGTDTLEMKLVKENLLQFAKEVGMKLDVNVVPGQKLEGLKALMLEKNEKEAMAINFGFGLNRLMSEFASSTEDVFGFLQTVKDLCPKVVAVVDCECEFEGPSAYMDALQFYSCIFESFEVSSKLSMEVVHNIESLVFGPKITDLVTAKQLRKSPSESGLPPWRILLQKVGFTPFPISAAAENQATWLVKNAPDTEFSFFKQNASLLLAWYSKTLISTSAWV